jgi:hypothetical protein
MDTMPFSEFGLMKPLNSPTSRWRKQGGKGSKMHQKCVLLIIVKTSLDDTESDVHGYS